MHEQEAPSAASRQTEADLEMLMERAARAMERMGVTVQDFLDELPAARGEVLQEIYGPAYMREIERLIAAYRQQSPSHQTTGQG